MIYYFSRLDIVLQDYNGPTHHFMVFFLAAVVILIIMGAIFSILWRIYRKKKLETLFIKKQFSNSEKRCFLDEVIRQKITDPLIAISDLTTFDYFAEHVARHFLSLNLPMDHLRQESSLFGEVRSKLEFRHEWEESPCLTSRSLLVGTPISVTCRISGSERLLQFTSRIIENTEFFLGIQPPNNKEIEDLILEGTKIIFEVVFTKSNDAQYQFDSHYIRSAALPTKMWIFSQSLNLTQMPFLPPLNLKGNLLFIQEESDLDEDLTVNILALHQHKCFFTCDTILQLKHMQHVFLNFQLPNQKISCRGIYEEVLHVNDQNIYQVTFNFLDEETSQILFKFQRDLRKNNLPINSQ